MSLYISLETKMTVFNTYMRHEFFDLSESDRIYSDEPFDWWLLEKTAFHTHQLVKVYNPAIKGSRVFCLIWFLFAS